ncbi:hypothetical protein ECOT7509_4839 [Escherichia coli TW07509]|nr:hypothetical protein ECOT7509_4839 [Escherichia coli TW07509]
MKRGLWADKNSSTMTVAKRKQKVTTRNYKQKYINEIYFFAVLFFLFAASRKQLSEMK